MKKRKLKPSKNKPAVNNEKGIHNFKIEVNILNKLQTSDDKKSEHESNIILNTNNFKNDIEDEFRLKKKRKRLRNKVEGNDEDKLQLKNSKNILIQSITCNDESNFTDRNELSERKFTLNNVDVTENSSSDEHNIQSILKKVKTKKLSNKKSVSFNNVPVSTKEMNVSPQKKQKKIKFKKKKKSKSINENVDTKTPLEEKINRSERALKYLKTWKYNRQKWKFEKLTQTWILKHMFNAEEVPDDSFQLLLEYMMNIKGSGRNLAIEYSQDVIRAMEKKKTDSDENSDENTHVSYQRARSILQYLQ